ncbi:sulfotransferase [Mangrovimicrobium sediminis]|uniref:Sulfotransferase n=1 Tax=Mangrovimicrobium sediminis TaxID=2562682 RepID=A0A4Z0M8Z6_9GAMM|nr:sulfotransferase [Haliea sp. SAOS-164]TGD75847.1 sulfotransferase [Haliea sp. SAOS-164]
MSEIERLKQALQLEPLLEAALAEAPATAFRDTSFIPNLEKVLEIPTRLPMSAQGLAAMHANNVRFLANRLRYEADVERHPEILDEDVSDPIVVLGLPRSGTTKLQRFLSADPNLQTTHAYRMFNPAPFPGEQPGDPTPRIEWTQRMMSAVTNTGESYQVMHEFDAFEAEESSFVPLANFDYPMQYITAPDPEFLAWARSVDRASPLSWLKKMLQYLQWQDGGRRERPWLLKNPGHTGEIADMLRVFPRATFVISQRDLTHTMGSSMRMMGEIMQISFDSYDPRQMADELVEYWSYELGRYQRQLAELGDAVRLVKTPYHRCVNEAISVAREVYALHGIPLTAEGEAAMLQWDRDNPRHKLGSYSYRLEDYGWNQAMVEDAFGQIAIDWRGY